MIKPKKTLKKPKLPTAAQIRASVKKAPVRKRVPSKKKKSTTPEDADRFPVLVQTMRHGRWSIIAKFRDGPIYLRQAKATATAYAKAENESVRVVKK